ncbi:TKL protein kinase [Saprolegnia parasitica CBS 223.65]|uniref:TKL protein kinase n=1 Tax=Saprolegnia parasitica (strain CBS 223.65) TaxID=695850 RepID=A0A067BZG2_SAPPC|nr:TKL protein kinase [Saprolegnia parasitica CBS 223.65]KDO19977.1 TKL protein kinase [Saprolegnia parasitica CBS 223.65]|eukprot:XP_012209347.1 TKL protein kinase [Saprolegnia parasitica CBS 223.65]
MLISLLHLVALVVAADACAFGGFDATATFVGCPADIKPHVLYCIVDSHCKLLKTYNASALRLSSSLDPSSPARYQLTVSYPIQRVADEPGVKIDFQLRVENASIRQIDDLSAVNNLKTLYIYNNNNAALSVAHTKLPMSLHELTLSGAQIQALPNAARLTGLTYLNVFNNNITRLEHLDLRNVTTFSAGLNQISTFINVSLGSGLTYFDLTNNRITDFVVDPTTYGALRQARTLSLDVIDVSSTCKSPNKVLPLSAHANVCVTPGSMLASSTENSTALGGAAIAGIVAGAVALVGLCLALFVQRRRRLISKGGALDQTEATDSEHPVFSLDSLALLRLDHQSLAAIKFVAEGAYGQVWLGTYEGNPVALKRLLSGATSQSAIATFVDEILLASKLESLYVVQLIGASWRIPAELQMVLEWMDRGDLRSVLEATDDTSFLWDEKIQLMLSVAEGLVYLHSMFVIHRDLKSRNVLLDTVKGAKLTDFGVSKEMTTETMTVGVGTYRWMAPEVLQENHYTTSADVYSFGILISELCTHHIPYTDKQTERGNPLVDTAIINRVIQGTLQPTFGASSPTWVVELANDCIALTADDRPTAIQVAHRIRKKTGNKSCSCKGMDRLRPQLMLIDVITIPKGMKP